MSGQASFSTKFFLDGRTRTLMFIQTLFLFWGIFSILDLDVGVGNAQFLRLVLVNVAFTIIFIGKA
ncbi:hypothetical protein [Thiomicrorhabdus sp.]|uniref:hypothetical protein n=1 Tax=Thiomicrorhabdus sp. TaxID=2039724 RepID=UPI0029C96B7D|nr:hypothetical protein [Thiomicrorhabdus sp.]